MFLHPHPPTYPLMFIVRGHRAIASHDNTPPHDFCCCYCCCCSYTLYCIYSVLYIHVYIIIYVLCTYVYKSIHYVGACVILLLCISRDITFDRVCEREGRWQGRRIIATTFRFDELIDLIYYYTTNKNNE